MTKQQTAAARPQIDELEDSLFQGMIEEDTPKGRVFDFAGVPGMPSELVYVGTEEPPLLEAGSCLFDASYLIIETTDGEPWDDGKGKMTPALWNSEYGDVATSHYDPEPAAAGAAVIPHGLQLTPEQSVTLRDANADFAEAAQECQSAKLDHTAKKKTMDETQAHLNAIVAAILQPPTMPLFDGEKPADTGDPVMPDDWRDSLVTSLGLPEAVVLALAENEPALNTLGELTDWQASKGDFWAKDIDGLGDAGRKKIEDALEAFWEKWNEADTADDGEEAGE